eukprot:c41727_g1_i1 orf=75-308(+)
MDKSPQNLEIFPGNATPYISRNFRKHFVLQNRPTSGSFPWFCYIETCFPDQGNVSFVGDACPKSFIVLLQGNAFPEM